MDSIKKFSVRLNLAKPLHKRAYDLIQSQSEFNTSNQAFITALVDYFEWRERETRLVDTFGDMIEKRFSGATPIAITPQIADNSADDLADVELDFDFLGG